MSKLRPQTYFGNTQGDHVTPYGLIKGAIEVYSELFLEIDKEIIDLRKKSSGLDSAKIELLQKSKQRYRDTLIQIFLAVSVFNRDVADFSSVDGLKDSSSYDNEGKEELLSSVKMLNTPNAKRRRNLKSLPEHIGDIFKSYAEATNRYVDTVDLSNEADFSFKNDSAGGKRRRYQELTQANNEVVFGMAKEQFCEKLQEQTLTSFNNINGITYQYEKGLMKELINRRQYFFEAAIEKSEGLNSEEESKGSGDSIFVKPLISFLKREARKFENRLHPKQDCEGKLEEASTRRSPRNTVKLNENRISDDGLLVSKFLNAFFLPGDINDNSQGCGDYDNSSTADRKYSIGELAHHLARHIFLIEKSFPFLTQVVFVCGKTRGEKINFEKFIKEFPKQQIRRHCFGTQSAAKELEQVLCDKVESSLKQFSSRLNEWDHGLKIEPTPYLKAPVGSPKGAASMEFEEFCGDGGREESPIIGQLNLSKLVSPDSVSISGESSNQGGEKDDAVKKLFADSPSVKIRSSQGSDVERLSSHSSLSSSKGNH